MDFRHIISIFICLFFCGSTLIASDADRISRDEIIFHQKEVPFYVFAEYTPQVTLRVPYAGYEIKDPKPWVTVSPSHDAYEIDLIFTKYPEDFSRWRTNYDQLLNDRVNELIALDSAFLSRRIRWNMILQTQCKTEVEAKRYFHGFVIKYRPKEVRVVEEVKSTEDLKDMLTGFAVPKDSSVIKIIDRHPEWKDMLVVMDWTGSMYQYGTQLVLWHKLNLNTPRDRTSHMVFFNDGDKKKSWQKRVGRTGGIYHCRPGDMVEIVETMERVMTRGNGGDSPENDIEALVKGISLLREYGSVVLIADNKSDVRDLELVSKIDKPIHIILCGVEDDNYINSDYVKIAFQTGGSLHTVDKDIEHLASLKKGERITIGEMDYMIKNGVLNQVVKK